MAEQPDPETPNPETRPGYRDSLDPADHLHGWALRVFRVLSMTFLIVIALAVCAFAVCAVGFRE